MLTQDGEGPYEPSLGIHVSSGLPGEVLESLQTTIVCLRLGAKEVSAEALSEGAETAKRRTPAALLREIFFIYVAQEVYRELTLKPLSAALVNLPQSPW